MVCAFTGHRPEHLPWRTDETDARCAALKAVLQREVSALYQRGFSAFLCGMARGCDLYFAEAVLALRDAGELPDANLTAMLPCPSQAARGMPVTYLKRIAEGRLTLGGLEKGAVAELDVV